MYETNSYIIIDMEYIKGGHLKKIFETRLCKCCFYLFLSLEARPDSQLNSSPLFSEEEASTIIRGVLSGLQVVHENDYIHRDIKMENIMLDQPDKISSDHIKLVDFGLSATFKISIKE